MKEKHDKINRRDFLKTTGAAALGGVFASNESFAEPNAPAKPEQSKFPQVPRRKLGKTGVEIPCLALGTMFNVVENQIALRKALDWGVNYWDTAHNYSGGNSEIGIGKFLSRNPEVRKKLFIVTKASRARTADEIEDRLQTSLKRMNTDYIDLYYGVHELWNPALLTNELKKWSESAKKRGLIRLFGFSTHRNMTQCLKAAARSDWIDAVLTIYNFNVMGDEKLQAAIEACHKAGVGLTAMKSQGKNVGGEVDKKLIEHFLSRGFTEGQAKIKLVLEDKRFSSACVRMENIAFLTENVAAVLDKTKLTQADKEVFAECALETCSGYCAGCSDICESAVGGIPYVSDIMRYLMYYNSYGDKETARELFAQIPAKARSKLLSIDYRFAEALCPQRMPIGKLIAEAASKLA